MEGNDQGDDFGDFFDTPGRKSEDFSEQDAKNDKVSPLNSPDASPARSVSKTKKHDRNSSGSVDRHSVSSDSHSSQDYSSDYSSDTDSSSQSNRRRKSRSRSASSRSAGSRSSRDSRSDHSDRRRNIRDSRSASSDRSRSRSASPDNHRRGKRGYQKDGRRYSSSDSITSTSTQSEDEKSGRRAPSPRPHRQAWTTDGGDRTASRRPQQRPKTAKRRSANGGEGRSRHTNHRSHLPVESDSDITDVSPISSPRNGSVNGHKRGPSSSGAKYNNSKPAFQAMPEDSDHGDVLDGGDSNALDLNILMKAVSELEKQKRLQANTRRVMFEPGRPRPMEKSNYTFTNDDTHRIETENKRLLKEIVRQMHCSGRSRASKGPDMRVQQATLTASAVNRRREQKRIENENLAFLKRLQKIKPTKGISCKEQLHSYNSTVLHGVPIASIHSTPSCAGSRTGCHSSASSVIGSLGSRTRSMSSIHSSVTASSVGTASRMSSRTNSRPSSAKKSVAERPPWNDRWWHD